MNLRTTPLLFGLLLGILWLFGLMLVYKKTPVDENLIVPTMNVPDVKIDTVILQPKETKDGKGEIVFTQVNDVWYLEQQNQKVKVEGFKIDQIVNAVKNAKRYEEERPSENLEGKGLVQPRLTVTLKGKVKDRPKAWQLKVGNEGAAKFLVYVDSSDRPNRAFPVPRTSLDALFFKDTAELRSKRLFDFVEPAVTAVDVKDGKQELALAKNENTWRFEKPALGFAGFEAAATADETKKDESKKREKTSGGVKGLINAIAGLHVENDEDFEPLGTDLVSRGVDDGKEAMRIEIDTASDKAPKSKDEKEKKDVTKDILLVGKRVVQATGKKGEQQYYARLLSDQGVFRLSARALEPIKLALQDPTRIRSRDVGVYDPKSVDAVVVATRRTLSDDKKKEKEVRDEVKLLHPDGKDWQLFSGSDKVRKGSEKAIQDLIEALQGKQAIESFYDGKDDAWGGLKGANTTEINVYLKALEKEKDQKADAKDEKKDAKKAIEKKDDKEAVATFKKDAKPFVQLTLGTTDKEKKAVHVKRVLQDGTVSRFTVPEAYVEKLHVDQGALAFLDPALPSLPVEQVAAIDVQRGKDKIELDMVNDSHGPHWLLKDVHDPEGKTADMAKAGKLLQSVNSLQARKWVGKDDPAKYGLKDPSTVVTIFRKNNETLTATVAASTVGLAAAQTGVFVLPPIGLLTAARLPGPLGETATVKFGKEIEEDKQKLVYAERSGTDLVFLVPADLVKSIRDTDLRDRSGVTHTQGQIAATFIGLAAGALPAPTLIASPLVTGQIHNFEPSKVTEVSVAVRTKVELRSFTFQRVGKDKTWVDQSGVKEFLLDTDKVTQVLDTVCKLRTDRFASLAGPTGENKLTGKEAILRIELTFEDKTTVTLTAGATFGQLGYFAHSSYWPEAVFFLPQATVDPWLQGAGYFGKERVAASS